MYNLNIKEINSVSGAGFWESLSSMVIGGTAGFAGGAVMGGVHGGDGGGIMCIGAAGQFLGMIGGGIIGGTAAAITAAFIGWNNPESITSLATQFWTGMTKGTIY